MRTRPKNKNRHTTQEFHRGSPFVGIAGMRPKMNREGRTKTASFRLKAPAKICIMLAIGALVYVTFLVVLAVTGSMETKQVQVQKQGPVQPKDAATAKTCPLLKTSPKQ